MEPVAPAQLIDVFFISRHLRTGCGLATHWAKLPELRIRLG
jgi:hypothetical protein